MALTAAQIQTDQTTPITTGADTTLLAPGTLTANAVTTGEVDLSWGGLHRQRRDVTGYDVERCQGSGCTNFAQIAHRHGDDATRTPPSPATTATATGSAPCDSAGNLSPYSSVATASTSLTVTPGTSVLTFTRTQQFTAQGPGSGSATWSVDGVAGGNASVGTITAGGLYTPPSTVGSHTVTATAGARAPTQPST